MTGLAYLLGIKLMPRIRNIKDLNFYRPDRRFRYTHIEDLFNGHIDWQRIERHLPDMLRVAVSGFKRKYTEKDVRLLAAMDERHDTPCGHAIKKLCERAYGVYPTSTAF